MIEYMQYHNTDTHHTDILLSHTQTTRGIGILKCRIL